MNEKPHCNPTDNQFVRERRLFGPHKTRQILEIERSTLFETAHAGLDNIQHLLEENNGICFFKTMRDDGEYQILVTDSPEYTTEGNTVIIINKFYSIGASSPQKLGVHMQDFVISRHANLLNISEEIMHSTADEAWETPELATLLVHHYDTVCLYGNFADDWLNFEPEYDDTLAEMSVDSEYLWILIDTLRYCTETNLETQVRDIS